MDNRKIIEFSVKGLVVNEGKFLILHKSGVEEDLWELPGGRMEFGEEAEETLRREILEETGSIVHPIKILDTWNLIMGNHQITGIIYLSILQKPEVILSDEHDGFKWIDLGEESFQLIYDSFKTRMINWDWNKIRETVDLYNNK